MNENISALPYFIHIKEPPDVANLGISLNPMISCRENQRISLAPQDPSYGVLQETGDVGSHPIDITSQEQPCIVQVIYPEDLNLGMPICKTMKRGRPKKKKSAEPLEEPTLMLPERKEDLKIPKNARTRSGRLVKLPKHIEKDFKKIEISTEDLDLKTSDFKRFDEKEATSFEFTEIQAKKRTISAQYRCPKCYKAYLGKAKMIQHLKKNPDHGPLPEGHKQEYNFDVWNYLFDITQKCKSGQRGGKFCEELSNLLHNVQLLKSALFKRCIEEKEEDNAVQIDKVLGNAIGLPPGKYKFDENELYKDVTVLKLITNSEFFKPNNNVNNKSSSKIENEAPKNEVSSSQNVKDVADKVNFKKEAEIILSERVVDVADSVKIQECTFEKKSSDEDSRISVPTDLLADNLLLHSLPTNARSPVDELILSAVDHGSNLLDNSTSSDEVMNVDQFVNERFKKFIGPEDMELDLPALEMFQFHTS